MLAQEKAPAEVVVSSWPGSSKVLDPSSALPPSVVTPCQPRTLPESITLQMPHQPSPVPGGFPLQSPHHGQSPLSLRRTPLEEVANMTKEHTFPPELAASALAKPNVKPETLNTLDAVQTPAQTKTSPAAVQDSGVKPNWTATVPTYGLSQHTREVGGWGSAITKGDNANPQGSVKPTLRLDHVRDVDTSSESAMFASSPEVPADAALSSSLKEDESDDGEMPVVQLTKAQKKRMREIARKQAQRYENSVRPPFGVIPDSVDRPVVQEPKPVDIPGGEGEGVYRCEDRERRR